MLGEQFMVGEEICGAVVSVRFQVGLLLTRVANIIKLVTIVMGEKRLVSSSKISAEGA